MSNCYPTMPLASRQRGVVLIVALSLLLVLTILAVSSMQVATTQERISGNTRDRVLAFQAAEAALRAGEEAMQAAVLGSFNGSNGRYEICAQGDTRTACQKPDWNTKNSTGWVVLAADTIEHTARPPEYIVEKYSRLKQQGSAIDSDKPYNNVEHFRVTARGFGTTSKSMVVLQTTYRRE